MTDARIPMLPLDEARAAADDHGVPDFMADLSIFRVLLRHPKLAKRFNDYLGRLLSGDALGHRLRELVIMRVGWRTGSDYEWTQHWQAGQSLFGVPADDLLATRDWRAHDGFGPAERAVLAATDEVLDDGAVSDETWRQCHEHVDGGDQALLELFLAIGAWRMVSGFLRSLEVPLEAGVDSWPPDGVAPDPAEVHG